MKTKVDQSPRKFVKIEALFPGDLFETENGVYGVRGMDSYILFHADSFQAHTRGGIPMRPLECDEKVCRLPKGSTVTLTQED